MTVNFNLLVRDKNGLYNIEMRCSHNGVRMRWNTRIKVTKEMWNPKKQCLKTKEETPAAKHINSRLLIYKTFAEDFVRESAVITNAAFVHYMNDNFRTTSEKREQSKLFDKALDNFIETVETRTNLNGETISKNRINNYKRLADDFKRFERQQGTRYVIENIGADTVSRFLDWLRIDRNLAPNTLQSRMKMLRTIIATITKSNGIKTDYQDAKVKGERVEHIVLTDDEINAMMNFDTSNNPRLDNVRRMFIVGITTGLRFSDFSTVSLQHIGSGILSIHQRKTGDNVQIPIHPKLQEIIDNGNMPTPISNQNFNDYLRELAMLAGVDTPIEVKSVQGGVRKVEFVPKWKLVSSHICRRSFASRLYRLGINPQIIMKLTGHRQLSTFMHYIVVSNEDVFAAVKNIW